MKKVIVEQETWFITEGETNYFGKLEAGHAYETDEVVLTFDNESDWKTELESRGLKSNIFNIPNLGNN